MYGLFSHFFLDSKANFGPEKDKRYSPLVSYNLPDTTISFKKTIITTKDHKQYKQSFCLIKKVVTNKGHELLFLLPSSDTTRRYLYEKLHDANFKQELKDSFGGNIPENFELLLQLFGYDFKDKKHKIIYNSAKRKIMLD